jgi:hypothetical protein
MSVRLQELPEMLMHNRQSSWFQWSKVAWMAAFEPRQRLFESFQPGDLS